MGWFLFLLAVAGGVAFAIWNFHRKTAARKAASEARFEKIFKGPAQIPANPPPPSCVHSTKWPWAPGSARLPLQWGPPPLKGAWRLY